MGSMLAVRRYPITRERLEKFRADSILPEVASPAYESAVVS